MAMPLMYGGTPYGMSPAGMYPANMYPGPSGSMPPGYPSMYPPPRMSQGGAPLVAPPTGGMPPFPQSVAMAYYSLPPAMMPGGDGRPRAPWRVVVHNLPWETSSEELLEAFQQWQPQEANVMKDRKTGYSK